MFQTNAEQSVDEARSKKAARSAKLLKLLSISEYIAITRHQTEEFF